MIRTFATLLAIAIAFAIAPGLRAAPLRTTPAFAFAENARAGTNFWCVFPDAASQWIVVMYEKRRRKEHPWQGPRYTYAPLVGVTKPAGASGSAFFRTMTVPPHAGPYCYLVAYRNGVQQPYRGWTAYNPFGWHTFGIEAPLKTLVAEIPPGTPARDIRNYERNLRRQWSVPLGQAPRLFLSNGPREVDSLRLDLSTVNFAPGA